MSVVGIKDQAEDLFVRGRTEKGREKSRGKSRSKFRLRKKMLSVTIVISLDTIKGIVLSSKKKKL